MENGKSALDQMNEILTEKESVIDRKKQVELSGKIDSKQGTVISS